MIFTEGCQEKIPEHKLVKKILIGLPKSYQGKVISIEDAYDLDTMKLDELLGNLKAFEQRWIIGEKKPKSVAFKATKKERNERSEEDSENLDLALITKQFRQFMKNKNSAGKNSEGNFNSRKFHHSKSEGGSSSRAEGNRFKQNIIPSGPTCFTCGGIGHMAADCGNKKYAGTNKSLLSTWSDDEEQTVAFVCSTTEFSDSDSDEDFEQGLDYYCAQMFKATNLLVQQNKVLQDETEVWISERQKLEKKFSDLQQSWEAEKAKLEEDLKKLTKWR
uniref:uncharacterized protein LOC105353250 n=1 Tax=Fragaria vesca subsp. vesca TaxID=101020 RepID=UPI0005CB4C04|nr:PREDICTED: uncharacterized protein LOC105353250 [Fragaria vesca subsp. vesca]